MKSFLVGFFSLVMIIVLIGGYTFFHFVNTPPSMTSEEVIYEVSPGKSFKTIAAELSERSIIQSPIIFSIYARFLNATGKIKIGEYALNKNMKPDQVLQILMSGKSRQRPFKVTEGLNIFEVAELYEKEGFGTKDEFLSLVMNPEFIQKILGESKETLEGFLFPETYLLTKFNTVEDLIKMMVDNHREQFSQIGYSKEKSNLTEYEILTLASIIEKETGAPQERPLISSVFHNRLKKGMKLQTDPTIIYGMAVEKKATVYNITKADILAPTRYNTYVIKGLPPGPIGNPGRASLEAALNPQASDFLFFVSQNDGTHVFSSNYEDHNKAVKKFQLDRSAREGKSWRDLQPDSKTN